MVRRNDSLFEEAALHWGPRSEEKRARNSIPLTGKSLHVGPEVGESGRFRKQKRPEGLERGERGEGGVVAGGVGGAGSWEA